MIFLPFVCFAFLRQKPRTPPSHINAEAGQPAQRMTILLPFNQIRFQSNPYFNYYHNNYIPGNSGRTFTHTHTRPGKYIPGENANAVLLPVPRRTRARPRCRVYHSAGKIRVFVILTGKSGGQTVPGVSLAVGKSTVPGVSKPGWLSTVPGVSFSPGGSSAGLPVSRSIWSRCEAVAGPPWSPDPAPVVSRFLLWSSPRRSPPLVVVAAESWTRSPEDMHISINMETAAFTERPRAEQIARNAAAVSLSTVAEIVARFSLFHAF